MSIKIKQTVGIYFVNPEDRLYKKYHQRTGIKKFLDSIQQAYVVRYIQAPNMYKIKLQDLAPLDRDINIVVIPSSTFFFDVMAHGDNAVIVVSLDSGNPEYSHGIYYQSLSLVRKFLGGFSVDTKKGSLFYRMKPEGKAIIVASMTNVVKPSVFADIYNKLLTIKLDTRQKDAIISILRTKKLKYQLRS